VASEFKAFRPASEVLTRVRAVPTVFPQFDHATRVGGFPIERITLLHGPSGHGKTALAIGFLRSFLEHAHLATLIDAERTTPINWLETAMGEHARSPVFFAERPRTYEETRAKVRDFCNTLRNLRDAGKVHEDTSALVVVDSIRKLVPKDIFDRIMKVEEERKAGDKSEKLRDRSAQLKAQANAAWTDELVPLLEEAGAAMLIIARETINPDADVWDKRRGEDYLVGGGTSLVYDASLELRVERASYVYERDKGSGIDRGAVIGERHVITIKKTKVAAGQEDRQTLCYFHTSRGTIAGIPEGFDRARDVIDLGKRLGLAKSAGSWIKWGRSKWQGELAAVRALHAKPDLLISLEAEARAMFREMNPLEITSGGEVIS
jgi:RecA/RadA recombinase